MKAVESLFALSTELGLEFPSSTRLGGVLRSNGMDDAVRFKLEMSTAEFPSFLAQTGIDPALTRPNMQGIFGPDRDFWTPHQVDSLRTGQVKRAAPSDGFADRDSVMHRETDPFDLVVEHVCKADRTFGASNISIPWPARHRTSLCGVACCHASQPKATQMSGITRAPE